MEERQLAGRDGQGSEANFAAYRGSLENYERAQGIEAEGIFDRTVFDTVLTDPRTVTISISADGQPKTLPLLTPLEHADWFNLSYHRRYAGADTPLTYYSHLSRPYTRDPRAYLAALEPGLRRVAEDRGVLVLEHTDHEADRINDELGAIASALAVSFTTVNGPEGADTKHYHYASLGQPVNRADIRPDAPGSLYDEPFYEALEAAQAAGRLESDSVTVSASLETADMEQIWKFYEPVFEELSREDPVHAGLNEAEFINVMQSPDCIKFVARTGEIIVNMCLLMNVKRSPWMNQFYYQQKYPDQYDNNLILCSPGVVTNPDVGEAASSLHTVTMIGRVIKMAGVEPVVTFACNIVSNRQASGMAQLAIRRGGVATNFSRPVGHQLFRMLTVSA